MTAAQNDDAVECVHCSNEHTDWSRTGVYATPQPHRGEIVVYECGHCETDNEIPRR